MTNQLRVVLAALTLLVLVAVGPMALAHEGHEHGPKVEITTAVAPRFEAASQDFELVGVLKGKELVIYLDRFRTNERIPDAKITATLNGAVVPVETIEDGTYRIVSPAFMEPKRIELIFTVATSETTDLLAGALEIASPEAKKSAPSGWLALAQDNRALLAGLAIGFMAGVLSVLIFRFGKHRRRGAIAARDQTESGTVEAAERPSEKLRRIAVALLVAMVLPLAAPSPVRADEGHGEAKRSMTIIADLPQRLPDGSLFVPKETQHLLTVRTIMAGESSAARTVQLTGQVIADPNGFGRVQSPVEGRIEAPDKGLPLVGQAVEKGQILAYMLPIVPTADRSVYESTVGEIDTQIALAEKKLARISRLPGVVPQKDIDDTRTELESLRKRRSSVRSTLGEREALIAPIAGVLSVSNAVPGQLANPRDTIFEIVDLQRLWVEAIAFDPKLAGDIASASAVASNNETFKLVLIGSSPSLRQQGVPIHFRIETPNETLAIGRPVTVILQMKSSREGMILPQAAVVRGANGVSIVWTHATAERFKPNVVKLQPLDGERVVIEGGLKPNERVVVDGATLLNQIR